MNRKRIGGLAALCFVVSACNQQQGRPAFLSDRGVSKEVFDAKGNRQTGDGLLYQFSLAADAAKPTLVSGQLSVPNTARQRAFMEAGFALILARCNGYILAKSDRQRGVNVTRDAFAPITALATASWRW